MECSPLTQQALRITCEFFVSSSRDLSIVLLTVIPTIERLPSRYGKYGGPFSYLGSTHQQRLQANQALRKAYLVLTQGGMVSDQIELIRREGGPAEEMVRITVSSTMDRSREEDTKNSQVIRRACWVRGEHSISTPTKMRLFMVDPGVRSVQSGVSRHRSVLQRTTIETAIV